MAFPYWKTALEIEVLRHQLERAFESEPELSMANVLLRDRAPMHPTEIIETDREIFVAIEMPGLRASDIDIKVGQNYFKVRYERLPRNRGIDRDFVYYKSEIRYGFISHMIPLPAPVSPELSRVEYTNGVLKVRLFKHHMAIVSQSQPNQLPPQHEAVKVQAIASSAA